MKRLLALVISLGVLAGVPEYCLALGQEGREISVFVNNTEVAFPDMQPYVSGERVMVPVRFMAEALGTEVSWYEQTQTVSVMDKQNIIALTVNSEEVTVNNKRVPMDTAAEVKTTGCMFRCDLSARRWGLR